MRWMAHAIDTIVDDVLLTIKACSNNGGYGFFGAFDSSGKHYFEGEQITSNWYVKYGLGVLQKYSLLNYWYLSDGRGSSYGIPGGSVSTPPYPSDVGTRAMVAYDMDVGHLWFGVNGTWFNGGNPETGANPIYTQLSGFMVTPMVSVSYSAQIRCFVEPDSWLYAPAGFSPPTERHPLAKLHAFHDIDRGGTLGIAGKVTELNRPGAYRVRLYDQERGTLLASTVATPQGAYAFEGLNEKPKVVVAFDHTNPLRPPAIRDRVVPS